MKTKRRVEITIETDEVIVLRHRIQVSRSWCAQCSEKTAMVTADQAAVVAGVNSRTIYRWVEEGKLHFTETPHGLLLICLSSLRCKMPEEVVPNGCYIFSTHNETRRQEGFDLCHKQRHNKEVSS